VGFDMTDEQLHQIFLHLSDTGEKKNGSTSAIHIL
jgi:hypothetical protein